MKNKKFQISIILCFLFLFSCSRSYNSQYFSFPPGSKPHEDDWTYLCQIISWDPFWKNSTEKGNRKVQIFIQDTEKHDLLQDELKVESASIDAKIKWEDRQHIELMLYERGNEYAEDEYNKLLIKNGPRHLVTLNYFWNGEKYIKNDTEHQL